jgi:hypothetical protein
MRLLGSVLRSPGERPPPPSLLRPATRSRGRPWTEYLPHVGSEEDAVALRRRGVPTFLLTSDRVTRLGYPVAFRPWLVVGERIATKVSTPFRVLPVRDEESLLHPGAVEVVVFLLRFDPLAARIVALRNRRDIDPHELYRRVRNEGLESAATRVRLQELSPAIPRVGIPISRKELAWIERNNPPLEEGK